MSLFICKFCLQERVNQNSLRNHERLCKSNPKRQFTPFHDPQIQKEKQKSNQYLKAKLEGLPIPEHKNKGKPGKKGYKHTDDFKNKQRDNALRRNLGGVRQSKHIIYNGKSLGSSYELQVAIELDKNGIRWDTCKKISYIDSFGKSRNYTPDFYLTDYNVYLDPKNDYLLNNVNPRLGFSDKEKINRVMEQNNIRVILLDKNNLTWDAIQKALNP